MEEDYIGEVKTSFTQFCKIVVEEFGFENDPESLNTDYQNFKVTCSHYRDRTHNDWDQHIRDWVEDFYSR